MQKRDGLLLKNARDLRKNMTKEERHLWYDFLCRYPIRFRRQEIIEPYIADFYCSQAGLVVELDGSQHYEESGKAYDAKRTALFEEKGIIVLRYSNADVTEHFESVCEDICSAVNKRIKASPARGGAEQSEAEG